MYIPTTRASGTNSDKTELVSFILPAASVETYWDQLEPFVVKAIEKSEGMLTVGYIRQVLTEGTAVAFLTKREEQITALFVVDKVYYASYCTIRFLLVAGSGLKEAAKFIDLFEDWALLQGAVEIEAWCRPAMVRLLSRLGWRPKFTRVTRNLRRKLQ